MFRLSNCLLLGVSAFTDETSLMQGLKPPLQEKGRRDKSTVANLLESAKGMLKNGETNDVVLFATDTLNEITSEVIPAIENSHLVEQQLVTDHFAFFETALAELEQANREIRELHMLKAMAFNDHTICRDDEHLKCGFKIECDYHLFGLWRAFVLEESTLRSIEERIGHRRTGHFCAQDEHGYYLANGTTAVFREASVPLFTEFQDQWPVVIEAERRYDEHHPVCEHIYEVHDDATDHCNADQAEVERASCAHRAAVHAAREAFFCAWNQAVERYDHTEQMARLMMIDRIREFTMLSTVQCLLERTAARNGRPCEESSPEYQNEVAHCEEARRTVVVSHLMINFPCEERQCADGSTGIGPHLNTDGSTDPGCSGPLVCPYFPPPCEYDAAGIIIVARCVPGTFDHVCTAGQVFPGLPSVPQPDFHDTNSHCNQRDPCEGCTALAQPVCRRPELVWYPNDRVRAHPDDSYRLLHPDVHQDYYPDQDHVCCEAQTASCAACRAGLTEAAYCGQHPLTDGCAAVAPVPDQSHEVDICCTAQEASCIACQQGLALGAYCMANPTTQGCIDQPCCEALEAGCFACHDNVTREEYCADNHGISGCEDRTCCLAMEVSCLACHAGVSEATFCARAPATSGCAPALTWMDIADPAMPRMRDAGEAPFGLLSQVSPPQRVTSVVVSSDWWMKRPKDLIVSLVDTRTNTAVEVAEFEYPTTLDICGANGDEECSYPDRPVSQVTIPISSDIVASAVRVAVMTPRNGAGQPNGQVIIEGLTVNTFDISQASD